MEERGREDTLQRLVADRPLGVVNTRDSEGGADCDEEQLESNRYLGFALVFKKIMKYTS